MKTKQRSLWKSGSALAVAMGVSSFFSMPALAANAMHPAVTDVEPLYMMAMLQDRNAGPAQSLRANDALVIEFAYDPAIIDQDYAIDELKIGMIWTPTGKIEDIGKTAWMMRDVADDSNYGVLPPKAKMATASFEFGLIDKARAEEGGLFMTAMWQQQAPAGSRPGTPLDQQDGGLVAWFGAPAYDVQGMTKTGSLDFVSDGGTTYYQQVLAS